MQKDTDLIKQKLDIVDFLRSYINLIPAGKNFRALCPFHQEKTPSFIVSPERQTWHCFGSCAEGGDVIKFVMKYENIEFPEALRYLAEKASITLQSTNLREEREYNILYDIHAEAKQFFIDQLEKHGDIITYLKNRGLNDETIREFEIGFSSGGEALVLNLLNLKFDVADMVKSGLAYKNKSGLYRDRFDGRIMFPIANAIGKTVAFTGRILKDSETEPKYVNSPESPVFNKSKILYGFHKSKNEIAHEKTAVVVEGQMDFLMAWQSGVKNTVAVSGTGLTNFHLEKLRRLADTIVLSFDNDSAGIKALERSLDAANEFDFHTKVLNLKPHKDPADAAKADPAFLGNAVKNALPAFTFLFDLYFNIAEKQGDMAIKKRVLRHLLSRVRHVRSGVERNQWVKELSQHSGETESVLIEELENLPAERENTLGNAPGNESVGQNSVATKTTGDRTDAIARRVLALAFTHPSFWDTIREYKERFPESYHAIIENPESGQNAVFELYASYIVGKGDEAELKQELMELLKQLNIEVLRKRQGELRRDIHKAQENGSDEEMAKAMTAFQSLANELDNVVSNTTHAKKEKTGA
ncbi:MAG: DNA primase [Candidatus Jorgensenbacteria bacterium]|nr:DNA primase [Candidatus Jorgensenbacteria bacterium]